MDGTSTDHVWRPEDLSPDWLTASLGPAVLHEAAVRSFTVGAVGTGQMGDSYRIGLELDRPQAPAPTSVVGKFTAHDELSRTTGVSMRTAEVEVRFYQQVAPQLEARIAKCFFADVDPGTARFVLLLEDLAPRTPGDQVSGCSVDEAALAVSELAKVHAPRWGDPALEDLGWLNRRDDAALDTLATVFPFLWSAFLDRYTDRLGDAVVRVGDAFFPRVGSYLRDQRRPRTVQHGDYRVDNLLFGDPVERVAIVDWQTVTLGPGASDLSYFLGGSLSVDDRRLHEGDLARQYVDALRAQGVNGYSNDDLWLDYRRHAYAGLVMTVGASMMVARTERGDDMFLAMAERHATHIEDMDSQALLAN
jgi:aminoglycoside/choline kinase family phosphotransferase